MQKRKHYTPLRLIVAAVIAIVIIIGSTAIHNIRHTPKQRFGSSQPVPSVPQQSLQPTNLEQVQSALGPFVTLPATNSDTPDTQYPAILLVRQDGSVAASQQWTVPYQPSTWAQQEAIQITNLTVTKGFVTFATSPNRIFTIRCNQPFILEAVPQYVMVIDVSGKQWQINSSRAETLRVHA